MLSYNKTIPFEGNPEHLLRTAAAQFAQQNFKIEKIEKRLAILIGPGMNSTKQHPVTGISKATLRVSDYEFSLEAELGGLAFMQRFVLFFPPLLCVVLGIVFYFALPNGPMALNYICIPLMLQFLILGLFLGWVIKRRTYKAIDTFLDNAVALEQSGLSQTD